jgi:hypothetical protein
MNKNIKKLAQAKADKADGAEPGIMRPLNRVKNLGGEDSPDQRRRLKAKPYRTERVSQTESAREIHRGGYTDSQGKDHDIGWDEPSTYEADNKGYSATMGRRIQETKRGLKKYGYTDKEAGLDAVESENWRRDSTYKNSDLKKYEDSGWNPNSPGGRAVEGAHGAYERYLKKSVALGRRVDKRLYAKRASISPGAPIRQNEAYWNS